MLLPGRPMREAVIEESTRQKKQENPQTHTDEPAKK